MIDRLVEYLESVLASHEKKMSIIISEEMEADVRPYTGVYDYCTNCGACIRRCPVKAIPFPFAHFLQVSR